MSICSKVSLSRAGDSEENPYDIIDGSWDDFSPEVGLDWRASDSALVYFTYSEGFKSGNAEIGNNNPTFVDAEEIENFEVGILRTRTISSSTSSTIRGSLPMPTPSSTRPALQSGAGELVGRRMSQEHRRRADRGWRLPHLHEQNHRRHLPAATSIRSDRQLLFQVM